MQVNTLINIPDTATLVAVDPLTQTKQLLSELVTSISSLTEQNRINLLLNIDYTNPKTIIQSLSFDTLNKVLPEWTEIRHNQLVELVTSQYELYTRHVSSVVSLDQSCFQSSQESTELALAAIKKSAVQIRQIVDQCLEQIQSQLKVIQPQEEVKSVIYKETYLSNPLTIKPIAQAREDENYIAQESLITRSAKLIKGLQSFLQNTCSLLIEKISHNTAHLATHLSTIGSIFLGSPLKIIRTAAGCAALVMVVVSDSIIGKMIWTFVACQYFFPHFAKLGLFNSNKDSNWHKLSQDLNLGYMGGNLKVNISSNITILDPHLKSVLWPTEVSVFDGSKRTALKNYLEQQEREDLIAKIYRPDIILNRINTQIAAACIINCPKSEAVTLPVPYGYKIAALSFSGEAIDPNDPKLDSPWALQCLLGGTEVYPPLGCTFINYAIEPIAPNELDSKTLQELKESLPDPHPVFFTNPHEQASHNLLVHKVQDFQLKIKLEQILFAASGIGYFESNLLAKFYDKHLSDLTSILAHTKLGVCDTLSYFYQQYKNQQSDALCFHQAGYTVVKKGENASFNNIAHATNLVFDLNASGDATSCAVDLTSIADTRNPSSHVEKKLKAIINDRELTPIHKSKLIGELLNHNCSFDSVIVGNNEVPEDRKQIFTIDNLKLSAYLLAETLTIERQSLLEKSQAQPDNPTLNQLILSEFRNTSENWNTKLARLKDSLKLANLLEFSTLDKETFDQESLAKLFDIVWDKITNQEQLELVNNVCILLMKQSANITGNPAPIAALCAILQKRIYELNGHTFIAACNIYHQILLNAVEGIAVLYPATFRSIADNQNNCLNLDFWNKYIKELDPNKPEAGIALLAQLSQYLAKEKLGYELTEEQLSIQKTLQDWIDPLLVSSESKQKLLSCIARLLVDRQINDYNCYYLLKHTNIDDFLIVLNEQLNIKRPLNETYAHLSYLAQLVRIGVDVFDYNLSPVQKNNANRLIHNILKFIPEAIIKKQLLPEIIWGDANTSFIPILLHSFDLRISDALKLSRNTHSVVKITATQHKNRFILDLAELTAYFSNRFVDLSRQPQDIATLISNSSLSYEQNLSLVSKILGPVNHSHDGLLKVLRANNYIQLNKIQSSAYEYLLAKLTSSLSNDEFYKVHLLCCYMQQSQADLDYNSLHRHLIEDAPMPEKIVDALKEFNQNFTENLEPATIRTALYVLLIKQISAKDNQFPKFRNITERAALLPPIGTTVSKNQHKPLFSGSRVIKDRSYKPEVKQAIIDNWRKSISTVAIHPLSATNKLRQVSGFDDSTKFSQSQTSGNDEFRTLPKNAPVDIRSVNWRVSARTDRLVVGNTYQVQNKKKTLLLLAADELLHYSKLELADSQSVAALTYSTHNLLKAFESIKVSLQAGHTVDFCVYFRKQHYTIQLTSLEQAHHIFTNPDAGLVRVLADALSFSRYEKQIYAENQGLNACSHVGQLKPIELAQNYSQVILNESGTKNKEIIRLSAELGAMRTKLVRVQP